MVGVILFLATPVYSISLKEIDSLYDNKDNMTELQWVEAYNNLKESNITLTGKIIEVEIKGFIFKDALFYITGIQNNIKFFAVCKSSLKTARLLHKGNTDGFVKSPVR